MTDRWFDEYVFEIAAPRAHLSKSLLDIYDHAEAISLPAWDPLGAAA